MQKKYIVRLTEEAREMCRVTVKKLKGTSEKVRRAQILLKADADGPGWTDQHIAEAFWCRTKTVETIRQRFVLEGFEQALERKPRQRPPTEKLLDGEPEAKIIATGMVQFLSFLGDSANAAGTTPFCQVMPAFFLM